MYTIFHSSLLRVNIENVWAQSLFTNSHINF